MENEDLRSAICNDSTCVQKPETCSVERAEECVQKSESPHAAMSLVDIRSQTVHLADRVAGRAPLHAGGLAIVAANSSTLPGLH